ncbi:MAG: flagellar biosynthetic protein FliR [Mariprofundaceae bacterium]|nr:flagellar biosynthetic protein FliR [Mariprofundaceae bacterium]
MVALLILVRVGGFVILIPVLGHKLVPPPVKAGLAVLITFLLYPVVSPSIPVISPEPIVFMLLAAQEMLLAGILALLANLIFSAVQFAGQMMSFQMGMSIANVFDPATSAQGAITAQLASVLAMLLWLTAGAHHAFLLALADSFSILPIGQAWASGGWVILNDAAADMFVLALRLVAPVLLLLFFVNVALGLVSRAVPQIQVFFVSFPLTVGVGLLVFALSMPSIVSLTYDAFVSLGDQLPAMMRSLKGG